ncbi:hypothetical protein TIFTF001_011812 [Ficus carica]|uniref:Uncharacterized protein n=1 Tax=Ficus carica TaxID=3494 RepID=A0AA87ZXW0_FICCA|nr:hypothetical protein TIFTF001_011812 [Ficus carica]
MANTTTAIRSPCNGLPSQRPLCLLKTTISGADSCASLTVKVGLFTKRRYFLPRPENGTTRIAAFDPLEDDKDRQSRFIELPVDFGRGWRAHDDWVRLGVVRGRLRLSQLYMVKRYGFVLKVWELNPTKSPNTTSWSLVHEVRLKKGDTNWMYVVAFHPYKGNVMFLLRNNVLCRYEVGVGVERQREAIFSTIFGAGSHGVGRAFKSTIMDGVEENFRTESCTYRKTLQEHQRIINRRWRVKGSSK